MVVDFGVGDTVRQLRKVGPRPPEHIVKTILKAGTAAFGPLLELATKHELLGEPDPDYYAPLHALRLLGELPDPAMVKPLLDKIPVPLYDPEDSVPQTWAHEMPQMLAKLGPQVIELLWAYAEDPEHHQAARGTALLGLAYVVTLNPEQRTTVVAQLRERLHTSEEAHITGFLVAALADLAVVEAYGEIMALYRDGKVDTAVITPASARQLLFGAALAELDCVKHTLWERYDEHGPFPSEYAV